MFLPLKDLNPTQRFLFVTVGLIVANAIVFVYELTLGRNLNGFVAGIMLVILMAGRRLKWMRTGA
jgi:hypothetical protein